MVSDYGGYSPNLGEFVSIELNGGVEGGSTGNYVCGKIIAENVSGTTQADFYTTGYYSTCWECASTELSCTTTTAAPRYSVDDCTTGSTSIVGDAYGYGPASVGEIIGWTDGSNYYCGEITSTSASGSTVGDIDSTGMGPCSNCNYYYGLRLENNNDANDNNNNETFGY